MSQSIGEIIKSRRVERGMTQEALAQHLHLSRQAISYWENNQRMPDLVSIIKISEMYQLSLDNLLKQDPRILEEFKQEAQDLQASKQRISNVMQAISLATLVSLIGLIIANFIFKWQGALWLRCLLTFLFLLMIFVPMVNNYLLIRPQYPEPLWLQRVPSHKGSSIRFGVNLNPRNIGGLGLYLLQYTLILLLVWLLPW
ncbi:helix-turn-helix transcriptional regulator [Convivina praedatoris]|uniref:HTH cro/C1-type domain-containing protein n=1 Tax=Convivina praedatoris TaxID=2880963 RepID=A0ABM9D5A4_9LACO|nr:helix-turn-helix domain-containing protein [Convivina sp. LMG 32447]CAH1855433.1 hypothetical protein R077815_01216 [Convivina sp. LMG 32447]CAH1856091.1 hypothetical protein LMG032447_01225 [Convivina sp. LMG 32447]CAH1856468.1 hypothetical protein R078138_01369 [Convivina sp. LMG 32447]